MPTRFAVLSRRGMILFIAVIVVAALSLGALTVSRRMTFEYRRALQRGDEIQAVALVQSGVEMIVAVVGSESENASPVAVGFDPTLSPLAAAGLVGASLMSQGVYDNAAVFAGVAVAPPLAGQSLRGVGRFTILAPRIANERLVGVRYGLTNESSKLSMLTVLKWEEATPGAGLSALLKLPTMTPRLAESLLDWIDADKTPRRLGAEIEQYAALGLSYGPRNDIPVSTDELLLIQGADREAIFGNDPERCYGYRRHGAWVSVAETLPLSFLLTAFSSEKLVTPQGEAKCFLGEANLEFLGSQLRRTLDSESVDFVIAYREAHGATFHMLDLLGATVVRDGKTLTSPFALDHAEGERRFFALLDYATESRSVVVNGRINILEAPACVLRAIPFFTEDQVREIVARRGDVGATREQTRRHSVWLLSQGIVDEPTMRKLWDFVTCGGDVYSAQVVGFFDSAQASSWAEVVVDGTVKPPRVVFEKEMSGVRHAYPPNLLRGATGL
ncbi:MAG: hypothetical protein ACRC46_14600 [Thermoguttaceae bacterium]